MAFADRFRDTATAQAAFADRLGEQASFDASLAAYVDSVGRLQRGEWSVHDAAAPRRNVLTYYGIGGIGKTTLLKKLADRLDAAVEQPPHWAPPVGYATKVAHCSLDASDFDPEDAILAIRSSLLSLGEPMPAFDMCIAMYWTTRHANTTLTEAFRRRGRLYKIGDSIGVGEQIQTGVEEICASVIGTAIPGAAAFKALTNIGAVVLRKRLASSVLRDCDGLSELLSDPPSTDLLPWYGHALAWDLERAQRKSGCRAVLFIDTFEEASRQAVGFIHRLAWVLPNVLFVIAGRNSLDWANPNAELDFSGTTVWPGLIRGASGEPRQHLVGYLSMEDRIRWLERVLGSACTPDVIDVAAAESHGLPVHLDLIAQHVLDISRLRTVSVDDAVGDLDVVARRVLRDLSDAQRRALLASCLYRRFDEELVRVTADLPNSGPIVELLRRPYLEDLQRGSYTFRLHDLLREVFREATGLGDDQWVADDWRRAANRGAESLYSRLEHSTDALEVVEHAELLMGLVASFGQEYDWLPAVAERLTSISNWTAEWSGTPMSGLPPVDNWASRLAAGVAIIMTRQGRNRGVVAQDLLGVLDGFDDDRRLDVVRYFLGQALRDSGDEERSLAVMKSLVGGSMARFAVKGIVHVLRRRGEFESAHAELSADAGSLQYADRVAAELFWTEGELSRAITNFATGAAVASEHQDGGEFALCLASTAWCHTLQGDFTASSAAVAEARAALRVTYQSFADLLTNLAEAFVRAVHGDVAGLGEVERAASRIGQSSIVAYVRFAACLASAVREPSGLADQGALAELGEAVHDDAFAYLLVIASSLTQTAPANYAWWNHPIVERWQAIVENLRAVVNRG